MQSNLDRLIKVYTKETNDFFDCLPKNVGNEIEKWVNEPINLSRSFLSSASLSASVGFYSQNPIIDLYRTEKKKHDGENQIDTDTTK